MDSAPASIDVVWFKRDLRTSDHEVLHAVANDPAPGGTVYLYVHEQDAVGHPTFDPRHHAFVEQCLVDLDRHLSDLGGRLTVAWGSMPDVLEDLSRRHGPIRRLLSHQETGHEASFARDRRVSSWCRQRSTQWRQLSQDGVERGLQHRRGWARRWQEFVARPPRPAPPRLPPSPDRDVRPRPTREQLGIAASTATEAIHGGATLAEERLRSFLTVRGREYTEAMSSPVAGWDACSRISCDLAWGTTSVRTAWHAALARQSELEGWDPTWARSVRSFKRRLAWRSHFMQKLESEPTLERRAMNVALDDLYARTIDTATFEAWRDGRTGFPLIDAGMRALDRVGWVNFRLRATLVSFACHHLGLDWRPVGEELARKFLDFEPGIHWPQVQMQASVTGINTVRIYSPIKQAIDVDPDGVFVRRWIPELRELPAPHHLAPHEAPPLFAASLADYPRPIIDQKMVYARERSRIFAAKARPEVREAAHQVLARHVEPSKRPPAGGRGRWGGSGRRSDRGRGRSAR